MTDGFTQVVDEASGGLISEARRREQQAQAQAQNQKQKRKGETVAESLGPVLDAEKTDIEFWMMVAQTVLLLVIARELRSGG